MSTKCLFSGITPPPIGREVAVHVECTKVFNDSRPISTNPVSERIVLWKERSGYTVPQHHIHIKASSCKWDYIDDDKCTCGKTQTMKNLLQCMNNSFTCSYDDMLLGNKNVQKFVSQLRIK